MLKINYVLLVALSLNSIPAFAGDSAEKDAKKSWEASVAYIESVVNVQEDLSYLDYQKKMNSATMVDIERQVEALATKLGDNRLSQKEKTQIEAEKKIQESRMHYIDQDQATLDEKIKDIQTNKLSLTDKDLQWVFNKGKRETLDKLYDKTKHDVKASAIAEKIANTRFSDVKTDALKNQKSYLSKNPDINPLDLEAFRKYRAEPEHAWTPVVAQSKKVIGPRVDVTQPITPGYDFSESCKDMGGIMAKLKDQNACNVGGVKLGYGYMTITDFRNPLSGQAFYRVPRPNVHAAYLGRPQNAACDTDEQLDSACMTLSPTNFTFAYQNAWSEADKKAFAFSTGHVVYDADSGSCAYKPSDRKNVYQVISAKEFCKGPIVDGKPTAFAKIAGYQPPSMTCDQIDAALAKLILDKPDNTKLLSMMIRSASLKVAALTNGEPRKTLEELANQEKIDFSGQAGKDFKDKLTKLYDGSSTDAQTVMDKLKAAKAGHFMKSTRFTDDESSAYLLLLANADDTKKTFHESDAAAVWAQDRIFKSLGEDSNQGNGHTKNFSIQVYHLHRDAKTKQLHDVGQNEADTAKSLDDAVQAEVQKQVDVILANTSNDALSLAAKAKQAACLKQGVSCGPAPASLGTESLDKIKTKITEMTMSTSLQGVSQQVTVGPPEVKSDGSLNLSIEDALRNSRARSARASANGTIDPSIFNRSPDAVPAAVPAK